MTFDKHVFSMAQAERAVFVAATAKNELSMDMVSSTEVGAPFCLKLFDEMHKPFRNGGGARANTPALGAQWWGTPGSVLSSSCLANTGSCLRDRHPAFPNLLIASPNVFDLKKQIKRQLS